MALAGAGVCVVSGSIFWRVRSHSEVQERCWLDSNSGRTSPPHDLPVVPPAEQFWPAALSALRENCAHEFRGHPDLDLQRLVDCPKWEEFYSLAELAHVAPPRMIQLIELRLVIELKLTATQFDILDQLIERDKAAMTMAALGRFGSSASMRSLAGAKSAVGVAFWETLASLSAAVNAMHQPEYDLVFNALQMIAIDQHLRLGKLSITNSYSSSDEYEVIRFGR